MKLMTLDIQIFGLLNHIAGTSIVSDALIVFFASYIPYILCILFLIFLYVSIYSTREKYHIFFTIMSSVVIARLGIVEIIRFFYHRPRPFVVLTVNKLLSSGWFYSDQEWSFPSGHSAFFFAMAMAIYCYNKKWGIGFFVAAFLINISRVIAGVHYPSDILGGAIIGVVVGYSVYFLVKKIKQRDVKFLVK